jgi:hypothetical protein
MRFWIADFKSFKITDRKSEIVNPKFHVYFTSGFVENTFPFIANSLSLRLH